MAAPAQRRARSKQVSLQLPFTILIFLVLFSLILYVAVEPPAASNDPILSTSAILSNATFNGTLNIPDMGLNLKSEVTLARSRLRKTVHKKREQLAKALDTLTTAHMPQRLKVLREKHEIVGERLVEIKTGKETVEEILHGAGGVEGETNEENINKPPMELKEIIEFLDDWIHSLHKTLERAKHATYEGVWKAYHDLAVNTLYPWDREYLSRMPERRNDGSIFMSIATYRDENCFNTVSQAYKKAKNPENLFIGLVQQNCRENCRSGVLEGGVVEDTAPDQDCYKAFCDTPEGKPICDNNQVRNLEVAETESLGPYAARYFASKLWYGEQWYMQIDAHMTFAHNWDAISIDMLKAAPSVKPVLSHYPPGEKADLDNMATEPGSRLCGPIFATSDLESQIIRLEGGKKWDTVHLDTPRFAPFTAAGYFVAHSDFLREVPFDPFLPWIFMGEEIIMSTRLWTAGYDIFSPSQSVVGHIYVRRHKPKFWESVHRTFTYGIHNPLQMMVLDRIKYQLGYPEAAKDMLHHKSVLTAVEQYSMGTERSLERYLQMVGLDVNTKEVTITNWCEDGTVPPGFEQYAHLYEVPKEV